VAKEDTNQEDYYFAEELSGEQVCTKNKTWEIILVKILAILQINPSILNTPQQQL